MITQNTSKYFVFYIHYVQIENIALLIFLFCLEDKKTIIQFDTNVTIA